MNLKKLYLIFTSLCLFLSGPIANAEEYKKWPSSYSAIGWEYASLEQDTWLNIKSQMGFNFKRSHTFYVTRPISNFLRVGVDVNWADVSITKYKLEFVKEPKTMSETLYSVNASLGIGLGIVMQPVNRLTITPYFHYSPSLDMYKDDEKFRTSFSAVGFSGGARVIYRFIGVGFEYQWSNSKASTLFLKYRQMLDQPVSDDKLELKKHSIRAFVAISF